ncbi:MAG: hypothetical protein HGA42_16060 [Nostocales cyanobacterium W4_Combined_metabat2_030]|nr:hypothetical protein [Nostocales cyanobacterium W4_Combined_metabat2_030]
MKGESKMDKDIKATQVRAVQYFFADGLAELSGAAICMLLAVYFLILQSTTVNVKY